jgi:hypothetical protein
VAAARPPPDSAPAGAGRPPVRRGRRAVAAAGAVERERERERESEREREGRRKTRQLDILGPISQRIADMALSAPARPVVLSARYDPLCRTS